MYKAVWGQAHTDNAMLTKEKDKTFQLTFASALSGSGVKVTFYNKYDKKGFTISEAVLDINGEETPITFDGKKSCKLALGECVQSDAASVRISKKEDICIRYAIEGTVTSGNTLVEEVKVSAENGNLVHEPGFACRPRTKAELRYGRQFFLPAVEEITVNTDEDKRVIVCMGDSITQKCQWTVPLRKMFMDDGKEASVINKGIDGNMLMMDPIIFFFNMFGKSGVSRFDHDILGVSGATDLIIALGTNDIVMGRKGFTVDKYIDTLKKLVNKAEAMGIKTYVCTITPRKDKSFKGVMIENRKAANERIRNEFRFIEYAEGMAAGGDLDTLDESCALDDLLHPNAKGGLRMAEIIYNTIK